MPNLMPLRVVCTYIECMWERYSPSFRPLVPFIEITGNFVLVTGGRMSELISVASEKTLEPISI